MRTTILLTAVLFAGCGEIGDATGIRELLGADEPPMCAEAKPGAYAITEPCRDATGAAIQAAPGVGCFTCRSPAGDFGGAGCAYSDDSWCVASCDLCPSSR